MSRPKRSSLPARLGRQTRASASPRAASRAVVEVVVPSRSSSGVTTPLTSVSARSDNQDFDTPNTTPAFSDSGKQVSTRRSLRASSSRMSLADPSPSAGEKRKRELGTRVKLSVRERLDTSRDEQLAQQLQDDEYNVEDEIEDDDEIQDEDESTEPRAKRRWKNPNIRVKLSVGPDAEEGSVDEAVEDEESEFSELTTPPDSADEAEEEEQEVQENADDVEETVATTSRAASSRSRTQNGRRRDRNNGNGSNRARFLANEAAKMARRKQKRREKLEAAHPEIKTMWNELKAIPVIKPVAIPQPKSINRILKSFQLEGVDWMIKQEKSVWKGGLLGDEMGMGKTIQAVSLIMSDFPAKAPSLVLVPPVALMQWQNEINSYTDNKLKVLVVHNSSIKSKNLTVKIIKNYNVILMSYNSLESMYRKQEKGWSRGDEIVKEDSPIHATHWHRVILDEAHSIKSRTTGCAKACFALEGTYKWCLSGTPVQNRIGEFFSLLRFLGVRPFADYFCEACDCAELHWTINDEYRCTKCNHSASEHRSVFNEEILNPIMNHEKGRDSAMDKLHSITDHIMLRRLKKDYTSSMELPPKLVTIKNEFFSNVERDFASSIMGNSNREFDTYVSRGVLLNNYANIFGLLMMMRQVANHPDLILKKNADGAQNVLVCNICDEAAEDAIRSKCKHDFCRTCVKTYMNSSEKGSKVADCPRCHLPLEIDLEQPEMEQDEDGVKKTSIINRIRMSEWTSSTKIELLVYELYKLRSSKRTIKSIVFSQFTSMLQLVEWRLRRAGFTTVMLDGSMSPVQRQRSIDYFMNNTNVEVFLVSLKAGGVALNLTEASRVFIVDPWWNPAAEWQSADRCHRIGQARPCVITRLVIEDSVESRMVQLQEKKANLIASTVNKDKVAMDKLTTEDLQFLFRGT